MILNDIITAVRRIIQDETVTFRYSDAFLLDLCNQGLKRIQLLRPDLFSFVGTVDCVENAVIQSAPSDSLRIIECYSIVGGTGLVEADREVLDQTIPTWVNTTAAAAINWMRHVRNPNKFFIYPKAPANQTLTVEYSQVPPTYAGDATVTLLPDAYIPALVDVVVFLAESIDNEHVTSGRAKMYMDLFMAELGATTASLPVTDTENAGQPLQIEVV
tara:strand:+ start:1386 stop:2033 length:648 start_codon:yes stop_codon:yes gene_type:complete